MQKQKRQKRELHQERLAAFYAEAAKEEAIKIKTILEPEYEWISWALRR
jgi:hypothetical protein